MGWSDNRHLNYLAEFILVNAESTSSRTTDRLPVRDVRSARNSTAYCLSRTRSRRGARRGFIAIERPCRTTGLLCRGSREGGEGMGQRGEHALMVRVPIADRTS